MAQYDLHLIQNVAPTGVEFSEKMVNLAKGTLLSSNASGVPTVLASGTDGYMLVRDDAEATGLKWIAIASGHTQNTDTGTTGNTFTVDSDSNTGKIIIDVNLGAADKSLTLTNAALTDNRTITFPDLSGTVALTSQLPSSPLQYKGVIDCSGNLNYPAATVGDVYFVSVAGKIGGASGVVVEVGDSLICNETAVEGDHATVGTKWNVVQKNIDGAVTGPASVTADENIAIYNGTTGKIIKDSGKKLSDYMLTWVTAPASKTATGTAGQAAYDTNYLYVCTASNTWKRAMLATNWS